MSNILKVSLSMMIVITVLNLAVFAQCPPEILYYTFKNNCGTTLTPNTANPGRGSVLATIVDQDLGNGGEFDSCLIGTGGTHNYLNTGWNTDVGTGNWTISFWINNLVDLNPTYLFGNVSSGNFRCFYGGAAGNNNLLLRGNFPDVEVCCVMNAGQPVVVHFVYNGSSIKTYKNGVFVLSFPASGVNLSGGTFQVGGYANHNCMNSGGKIDEFRFYSRALSDAEISLTWNKQLGCITGMNNNSVPEKFALYQNFPNPFNPMTKIKYDIAASPGAFGSTGVPSKGGVNVTIAVYDILGKKVSTLVNENKQPGSYEVEWDGTNYPSGVYIYKLETEKYTMTKKMMLVK